MIADGAGTTVWIWDQQEPFANTLAAENPSGLGAFEFSLRLPGQYFDRETNLHYNYFRDYDPAMGRYSRSDPIGLKAGLNTYAYVGSSPLAAVDWQGLASFTNFSPERQAKMQAAIEEAKEKLRTCDTVKCGRSREELDEIAKKIDNADYVYDPKLGDTCGRASTFPFFPNTIKIGLAAFFLNDCCDLSSTIAHEANHLRNPWSSGSERASRDLEDKCFNCPRRFER
jgi:RHS repeat-associated protein